MGQVLSLISGLSFGHFTLLAVLLTLLITILAGVLQLGIISIRKMLALDDVNAPDWKMENVVWGWLDKILIKAVTLECPQEVVKFPSGYAVRVRDPNLVAFWGNHIDCDTKWHSDYREEYCMFDSIRDAIKAARMRNGVCDNQGEFVNIEELNTNLMLKLVISIISLDIVTILMQYYPLQAILIGSLCVIFFGVRKLAKTVWRNTGKIKGHEGRIGKLEEGVEDNNKGEK